MKFPSPLEDDHKLLLDVVRKAGQIALEHFGDVKDAEWKQDGTPVSEVDLKVDNFLKETLIGERPSYGWLSEESELDHSRLGKDYVWVVDPIDGTRSFINHKPEWTVSVALVHNNQPVLGAVYNPVTDQFFEAVKGHGARLNSKEISVSSNANGPYSIIASKKILKSLENCNNFPLSRAQYINSIAYRICLLANGDFDVVISKTGSHDWDIVAAHLILDEAGGRMTSTEAEKLQYNQENIKHPMLLATNNSAHNNLLKFCEDIGQ